jgi:hypothetical protein
MTRTSITIVLELDLTMDSPAGRASTPGGPSREFHGWLGLTEAIDALGRAHMSDPPADKLNGEETP